MIVPRARLGRAPRRARIGGATSSSSAASCSPTAARTRRRSPPSARSAIGPCMLPVDADGEPLMNAVLYGVDTRAATRDRRAHSGDRRGRHPRALRQRADLAIGRAEDPLAQAQPPRNLREDRQDPQFDLLSRSPAHRPLRHRPLHGCELEPALSRRQARLERRSSPPASPTSRSCPTCSGRPTSPAACTNTRRRETGLALGTPVIAGTIDAAAEALSVGVARCRAT